MKSFSPAVFLLLLAASCDEWPGVHGDGGMPPAVARMEDRSGNLGSACDATIKCNHPLICLTTAPGGLCTKPCMSDADCSAYGASCLNAGGLMCVKNCFSDQMCREGYSCTSVGTTSVCLRSPVTNDR